MHLKSLRINYFFFFFLLLSILTLSCKKDLNEIGLDLVSPGELIRMGYTDTVQVQAFSVAEDSIRTYGLSYALIGSMYDPVFGKTSAEWYSQIRLVDEPTDFGTHPVFDSAFLYLPFNNSYGDTLSNMTLKVFELTEGIVDSVHNYSNKTIAYDDEFPLGQITFTPKPHDSTYYNGYKHTPVLRIKLNSRFGNKILNADTTDLADNESFLEYFKGIGIVADQVNDPGKGAILKLTVSAVSSYIDLYYHNDLDTSIYSFEFNSECKRFNRFNHNGYQEASPLLQQQLSGDTTLGGQFLFLQAMGGVRIKLKFPNLVNWKNKDHILINDAQLIFSNAMPSTTFPAPSAISVYPVASDGSLYPYQLPDADEGTSFFDGTYNTTQGTYRFRLTHYVQQILNGKQKDYGLFMVVPTASLVSSRLVLSGTHAPTSGLKLYIKYTVIP